MMPVQQQVSSESVMCFGKMPTHGDFVRHNAQSPAARALDEWLQEALYHAKPHLARNPAEAGGETRLGFVFSPPGSRQPLAGVMQMTKDRVGRDYPFVAAVPWDAPYAGPQGLPASVQRLQPFLAWASGFVAQAASGAIDHRDLASRATGVDGQSAPASAAEAPPTLSTVPLSQFCERLWGTFEDGRKYRAFRNLIEALRPLHGTVPSGYALGLRFPIASRSEWPVPLDFWLSAFARLVPRASNSPALFFTEHTDRTRRPYLMLYPGAASPRSGAALFAPAFESSDLLDVERAGRDSDAEAALSLPASIGQLLEEESTSLREVVESL